MTKKSNEVKNAVNTLKRVMKKDAEYAYGWHSNIAVMMQDAGASYEVSNEGAKRFMKLAFGVEDYES